MKQELKFGTNDLYISPLGSDSWSGRLPESDGGCGDGPLASINKARDILRDLKESGRLSGPTTVWLRDGRYELAKPIEFLPEDSGPITFAAYPGERPILDGGRRIDGWRVEELANGRAVWVADIDIGTNKSCGFRQLFVGGERRPRARLPKSGYYWMADVPDIDLNAELFDGSNRFQAKAGDVYNWRNLHDVEAVAVHYWVEERLPIASFDESTRMVTSTRRSIFALKDDVAKRYAKYYVENVYEALEEPGEWYFDRDAGKLYYIPMSGETLGNTEVFASHALQLLKLTGRPDEEKYVEYLRFQGLTFAHTDWCQPDGGGDPYTMPAEMKYEGINFAAAPQAAYNISGVIRLEGTRYCSIEACKIEHVGLHGIELADGCSGNRIVGNEVFDTGAGGIKLNGSDATGSPLRRTGNNRITDNHVHQGGRVFHSAVGILSAHSFGNVISHNHIHDYFYTGISCGWVWGYAENVSRDNHIEKNHIHDLGHGLLSDMGGIYTLGVQPGTVIRGNVVHDVEKCNYGGWAIYPDEGSSHILIENNVCYRTSSQVFHQHYGRENIVRNNIFAFGREGIVSLSRAEEHNSFTFERNILLSRGEPMFVGGYAGQVDRRGFKSDLNVLWNTTGSPLRFGNGKHHPDAEWYLAESYSISEWKGMGYDLRSELQDPQFIDFENGDFQIGESSPAISLGFKPIDISDVGPRSAEAWD